MSSDAHADALDLQPFRYDGADEAPNSPAALHPALRRLAGERTKDYLLWSLFNLFFLSGYCFSCLSFAALVFSVKSRDCKVVGDPEKAAIYGKKARCLNIAACIIGIGVTVVCFLAIILSGRNILELFAEMKKPQ